MEADERGAIRHGFSARSVTSAPAAVVKRQFGRESPAAAGHRTSTTMTTRSLRICCFDLGADGPDGALRLQVAGRPLTEARLATAGDLAAIAASAEALRHAEHARRGGSRFDPTGPLREHGEAIYRLLDGPGRELTTALHDTHEHGRDLLVVIRLLGNPRTHPAAAWRFELAHDGDEHVARRRGVQVVVQYGDRAVGEPQLLDHGRLRILFMAYSPQGIEPVLDYEGEEEAVLEALAPNVEAGRVRVEVVEDGTLAELGRRLKTDTYDVVYLSGHGELREDGPVLLLEDEVGGLDLVGTERLFDALKRCQAMPRLVVLASCETAGNRDDVASMAAGLVARGVPAVLGWVRPVADADATQVSRDLLDQLATGHALPEATAFARRELADTDAARPAQVRTHGWSTMHLATADAAGFVLDVDVPPPETSLAAPAEVYKFLGDGRMRVLQQGFVGRRRPLQRLIRILRQGKDGDEARAGAVVIGMKGVGKSCLAGRAIDRHFQDSGEVALLVLHGALDDATFLEQARRYALTAGDREAEKVLEIVNEPVERRIERLLLRRWSKRTLIVVLDDFEQNLELRPDGLARLMPFAARLLGTLLPACRTAKAKVLITSTADFELAPQLLGSLTAIELGPLEPNDVRKLWTRGRETDLREVSPAQWAALAERLGRNARILDWARTLLGGGTSREIEELVAKAQAKLPEWREGAGDVDAQNRLVALFLFHAALDRAQAEARPDVRVFLERARVYDIAVPIEALLPMGEGLQLDLQCEIPALANLGLLEFGSFKGRRAYRVSPLVVAGFNVPAAEHWQRAAALFFEHSAKTRTGLRGDLVIRGWQHSLLAGDEELSDRLGARIYDNLRRLGQYPLNAAFAQQPASSSPPGYFANFWAGISVRDAGRVSEARQYLGRARTLGDQRIQPNDVSHGDLCTHGSLLIALDDLPGAQRIFERSLALAHASGADALVDRANSLSGLGHVLHRRRFHDAARQNFEEALRIRRELYGTNGHPHIADSLCELAGVLEVQGELTGALAHLEESLRIRLKVCGTDHPAVADSLCAIADVLRLQGDLSGARRHLEDALQITRRVPGSDEHPMVAKALRAVSGVYRAQGDIQGARQSLERSLAVMRTVFDTDEHPDVADCMAELAGLLRTQGDLPSARQALERAIAIRCKVFGDDASYEVAKEVFDLALLLKETEDLSGAREHLERFLAIWREIDGTDEDIVGAVALRKLARVLHEQEDHVGALRCLRRCLRAARKTHGTGNHADVAAALHDLGRALAANGDVQGAVRNFDRALAIRRTIHGTTPHLDVADSLRELAVLRKAQGDLPGARKYIEEALSITRAACATDDDIAIAYCARSLAAVLVAQGEYVCARQNLKLALATTRRVRCTDEHIEVADILHKLAHVLRNQGQERRAETCLRRALGIRSKLLGTRQDLETAEIEVCLGMLLLETGRRDEGAHFLTHGFDTLRAVSPGHHLLEQFPLGPPSISPNQTANEALGARQCGERNRSLDEGLTALRSAGGPAVTVALYLDAIARRADPLVVPLEGGARSLDEVARDLPKAVAKFLRDVRDAALAADAGGGDAP